MFEDLRQDICPSPGDCIYCDHRYEQHCKYRLLAEKLHNLNYRKSITAYWIDEPDEGIWVTRCSNCETARPEHEYYLYCPDCGAFMENGE